MTLVHKLSGPVQLLQVIKRLYLLLFYIVLELIGLLETNVFYNLWRYGHSQEWQSEGAPPSNPNDIEFPLYVGGTSGRAFQGHQAKTHLRGNQ